jgi:hypothetical protein
MRQGSKALQAEKRQLLGFLSSHRDRVTILGQMIWIKLPIVSTDWLVITMWVRRLLCLSRHGAWESLKHMQLNTDDKPAFSKHVFGSNYDLDHCFL